MKITKRQLRKIIKEQLLREMGDSAYGDDGINSAFESGMSDAQAGVEPDNYPDWVAKDPEMMDAYDAGYEEGLG